MPREGGKRPNGRARPRVCARADEPKTAKREPNETESPDGAEGTKTMKVDERQVADILKTLPVGFYLGNRAEVVLDAAARTSFVSIQERNIHVALANVQRALAKMPNADERTVESAIRAQLYHEVAHLMLTPEDMYPAPHRNICEDARIETLLRNRFLDTDFDAATKAICGYDPATWRARDEEEFLFGIVRYRNGPKDLIAKFDAIVRKYAKSAVSGCDLSDEYDTFAREVYDRWSKNPNPAPQPEEGNANSQNAGSGSDSGDSESGEEGEDGDGAGTGSGEESASGEESESGAKGNGDGESGEDAGDSENAESARKGEEPEEAEGTESAETAESEDGDGKAVENAQAQAGEGSAGAVPQNLTGRAELSEEEYQKAAAGLSVRMNANVDPELDAAVERLIYRATRRRANKSAAQYGYAGTVDPFAVACRQDFRWLTKRGDGNKGFDRIHLRLWVDVSGSFESALPTMNRFISAVLRAEKKMPEALAVSIIKMSDYVQKVDKAQELVSKGCNSFSVRAGVVTADAETRKAGWRTVNVCVWDGAMTSMYGSSAAQDEFAAFQKSPEFATMTRKDVLRKLAEIVLRNDPDYKKAFDVLNTKDTVIVSDGSNERYLDAGCPKARKEYVRSDYCQRFVSAVLQTMGRVL